jgi:hypothetical protein
MTLRSFGVNEARERDPYRMCAASSRRNDETDLGPEDVSRDGHVPFVCCERGERSVCAASSRNGEIDLDPEDVSRPGHVVAFLSFAVCERGERDLERPFCAAITKW